MVRLHMIVEGQTEEAFVKGLLVGHLAAHEVCADVRLVETGRRRGTVYRGGMTNYQKIRRDIERWIKEDRNRDVFFTTMFDLYRLPRNFPQYDSALQKRNPYERVRQLETAFAIDLNDRRFVPYIQLHEFETLLFADPTEFGVVFVEERQAITNLVALRSRFSSPELIDDGETTAPSKRIISEIPAYEYQKASAGPLIASAIGLTRLTQECEHFRIWVDKLAALAQSGGR